MTSRSKVTIAPGAVICKESELHGEITIGSRTVIHPKARIVAEAGPIVIGESNLIEEQVQILNVTKDKDGSPTTMVIGANNVFEVGAHTESMKIGDHNVLESKCRVGRRTELTSGCVIGAKCEVVCNETIPENTVIYGSNCDRRIQAEKSAAVNMAPKRQKLQSKNCKETEKALREVRNKLVYSEENMLAAIKDVKTNGLGFAAAARKHNVPRMTLSNKVNGKTPMGRRMGPQSVLTQREEDGLVEWIKTMRVCGFPITKDQLKDSVRDVLLKNNRKNTFIGNRPGKKWLQLFLKRNPSISSRVEENLAKSRTDVSKENVEFWFHKIEGYLKRNGWFDILRKPNCCFNGDESAFFLNPKGKTVLATKGSKSAYSTGGSDDKECLTVLLTASADGTLAPPMIVFPYETEPSDIANAVNKEWGIGKSENGWMTKVTFYEYIISIFEPWLEKNKIPRPVIFFVNGHASHMSYHLSAFCQEKQIILIALPPNTTHFLQPMSVSVFGSLKEHWKTIVHDWRVQQVEQGLIPQLKKENFCPLVEKMLKENLSKMTVVNGFRQCGLVPWNFNEVTFSFAKDVTPVSSAIGTVNPTTSSLNITNRLLLVFEDYIGKDRLQRFKQSSDRWSGPQTELALHEVWLKMTNDLKSYGGSDNLTLSDSSVKEETFVELVGENDVLTLEKYLEKMI